MTNSPTTWKQAAPTQAFIVALEGAWYGQGDTRKDAIAAAKRQIMPGTSPYNTAMWNTICRKGKVIEASQL